MNKLERLAYWKDVAGDTSPVPWVNQEDDLYGFFQRFRPDGRGVARVFQGVKMGDAVLARLLPFSQHTKEGAERDAYFVVRKPQVTNRQELLELMTQYLEKVRQMAVAADVRGLRELVTLLGSIQIEIKQGEAPPHPVSPEPSFALIYDTLIDWFGSLEPVPSDVLLLEEAFYSMACEYPLAWYIMWPLYRESTAIQDPFAPYFQLWIRRAEFRFTNRELLTVYSPSLAD
jgi:hypothetical protein